MDVAGHWFDGCETPAIWTVRSFGDSMTGFTTCVSFTVHIVLREKVTLTGRADIAIGQQDSTPGSFGLDLRARWAAACFCTQPMISPNPKRGGVEVLQYWLEAKS